MSEEELTITKFDKDYFKEPKPIPPAEEKPKKPFNWIYLISIVMIITFGIISLFLFLESNELRNRMEFIGSEVICPNTDFLFYRLTENRYTYGYYIEGNDRWGFECQGLVKDEKYWKTFSKGENITTEAQNFTWDK